MRLIDAVSLKTEFDKSYHKDRLGSCTKLAIHNLIDAAPTIYQIVRCKNCKRYEIAEYDNGVKYVCRLLKRQMQEDDFCSYGEKRG